MSGDALHLSPEYRVRCAYAARDVIAKLSAEDRVILESYANAEFWAGWLSASSWQPIATADPIQFQVALLGRDTGKNGGAMPCYWDGDNWKVATIFAQGQVYRDPTHWMPLPAPPVSS